MLTADIALDAAVLDLIDNSVDAITALNGRPLDEDLIRDDRSAGVLGRVDVKLSPAEISISDDGIGIRREDAEERVFRLGRASEVHNATIGAFGIGLKRALFKLGNTFEVASRQKGRPGFRAHLDNVDTWSADPSDESHPPTSDEWSIPLAPLPRTFSQPRGTVVKVTQLREDVRAQIANTTTIDAIVQSIGRTYCLLIGRYVQITVNGKRVPVNPIPLGTSSQLQPAVRRVSLVDGKVSVTILTGLMPSVDLMGQNAGWYILCNGRIVLAADKTSTPGWGTETGGPLFVPLYRRFVGVALFFSADVHELPWRTTKRGVNTDAQSFREARPAMWEAARPVISYLRTYYKTNEELEGEKYWKRLVSALKVVNLSRAGLEKNREFSPPLPTGSSRTKKPTAKEQDLVTVHFSAKKRDIKRGARVIGEPGSSAVHVCRTALNMLIDGEL